MRGHAIVLVSAMVLGVAACSERDPIRFDGESFRMKAKDVSKDRRKFVVEIRDAAGREDAAMKAARYQATLYCLGRFGTSDMVWANADDEVVLTGAGALTREGECASR